MVVRGLPELVVLTLSHKTETSSCQFELAMVRYFHHGNTCKSGFFFFPSQIVSLSAHCPKALINLCIKITGVYASFYSPAELCKLKEDCFNTTSAHEQWVLMREYNLFCLFRSSFRKYLMGWSNIIAYIVSPAIRSSQRCHF